MKHRIQVKFGELAQEISIVHGVPEDTVRLVLAGYSAAIRRLLSENIIVEVAEDLRLQMEEYTDHVNNRRSKRIVVNPEYSRLRRNPRARAQSEIEKENEQTGRNLPIDRPPDGEQ